VPYLGPAPVAGATVPVASFSPAAALASMDAALGSAIGETASDVTARPSLERVR
jgi:hypothetical protein